MFILTIFDQCPVVNTLIEGISHFCFTLLFLSKNCQFSTSPVALKEIFENAQILFSLSCLFKTHREQNSFHFFSLFFSSSYLSKSFELFKSEIFSIFQVKGQKAFQVLFFTSSLFSFPPLTLVFPNSVSCLCSKDVIQV